MTSPASNELSAMRTLLTSAALPARDALMHNLKKTIPVDRWNDEIPMSVLPHATWNAVLAEQFQQLAKLHPDLSEDVPYNQLGTLGDGYIEIAVDESDRVWFVAVAGSRDIGPMLQRLHFTDPLRTSVWLTLYAKKNRVCLIHQMMQAFWESFPEADRPPIEQEIFIDRVPLPTLTTFVRMEGKKIS